MRGAAIVAVGSLRCQQHHKAGRTARWTRALFMGILVALWSSSCFAMRTTSHVHQSIHGDRATKHVGDEVYKISGRSMKLSQAALPEPLEAMLVFANSMPQEAAELGSLGAVYFFAVYVIVLCIALPASPLTVSAGYLFGIPQGLALTVLAGCTAAAITFTLSRTFLRPQITQMAAGNEQFMRINKAVEKEGFKIIALLRLSPLIPFAISNYVLGLSSVSFSDFIAATVIGFTPGAAVLIALSSSVREVAKSEVESSQPWYFYVIAIAITFALFKLVADIAKSAVDEAVDST